MWSYNYTNELYHFGIKGQRWGIRRYQNNDGSLTSAGRKRYSDDPIVVKTKQDMKTALVRKNDAQKTYEKASDTYMLTPTDKNKHLMQIAEKEYNAAKNDYKVKSFDYKTEKETARIKDKNISFNDKSNHRLKLEQKYKEMGLDDEHAQAAANNRIRAEKILAASAALTVTACAAYYINSKRKNKIDGIIKAGESLQRIEMEDTNGKLYDTFYAAKGNHDSKRYANLLGMQRKQSAGKAYMMKLEASKDVKVASKDNAAKLFGELYKNDPDFKKAVEGQVGVHFNGSNRIYNTKNVSNRNIKKMYENFNSNLPYIRDSGSGADKKFFNKLKSKGYGAIQDINDMKYSGYHAKNPLIVFDNSNNNIMVKSVKEMNENLNVKGNVELLKAVGEQKVDNYIRTLGPLSAAGLTTSAVITYVSDPKNPNEQ